MANIKFTELSLYPPGTTLAEGDKIAFVDINDSTMGSSGTNKNISSLDLSNSVAELMSTNTLSGTKIVNSTISPTKLSAGSPQWTTNGNLLIGGGQNVNNTNLSVSIGKSRSTAGSAQIQLFSGTGNDADFIINRQNNGIAVITNASGTGGILLEQNSTGYIAFTTNADERLRITSTGNVGIGTSTPSQKLEVVGTIKATSFEGPMVGTVSGNAESASKLLSAKTIAISGAVTGTGVSFDGSENITITTTIPNTSIGNDKISTNAAIVGSKIVPTFGAQNISTTGSLTVGGASSVSGASSTTALTVTQTGEGNVLVLQDQSGTDSSPIVVNQHGSMIIGHTAFLNITGSDGFEGLQLAGDGSTPSITTSRWKDDNLGPSLTIAKSRGAGAGNRAIVQNNDSIGNIAFMADDGGANKDFILGAQILARVDGTPGVNDMPTRLEFHTTADGASTPTERMRITSSGVSVTGAVSATSFSGSLTGIATGNIKQGGGTSQTNNTIYMGWSATSQLRVQVDNVDFGVSWPINVTGSSASCTGNASTATTAITASTWATPRTLTIGSSGKSVNGSADISWSHNDIATTRDLGTGAIKPNATTDICTTAEFVAAIRVLGAFLQRKSVYRCSWNYAGNADISDTGFGALELAGCIIETFTDSPQANNTTLPTTYHIRVTSPNTGTGAGGIHEYNNHGTEYSPGWRRVYTSNLNGNITGNAATATLATKASTLANNGGNGSAMNFHWSGQVGQPSWLWGGNDGSNMYVYNPSNFSVNYATSAGSATTAAACTGNAATATSAGSATLATKASTLANNGGNGSAMNFHWSGQVGQPAWLWGGTDGSNMYVYNPSNFSVNYATSAGSATTAAACTGNAATATSATSATTASRASEGPTNGTFTQNHTANANKMLIQGFGTNQGNGIVLKKGVVKSINATAVLFQNSAGTTVGSIVLDAQDTTNYNASSDYRLKEDFKPIEKPIDRLCSLKPLNFNWIDCDKRMDGFLAHEVQEVVPNAVTGDKDAVDENGDIIVQQLDYSKLIPLLTAAMQEQQKIIDSLVQEVNVLKNAIH